MATKSVGTLSAKLLLDTKGWTGGFAQANKTADKFSKSVGGGPARFVAKLAGGFLTAAAAIKGVRLALRGTMATFAAIEKEHGMLNQSVDAERAAAATKRLGLELSKFDASKVTEANRSARELAAVIGGIAKKLAVELAPTISTMAKDAMSRFEAMGNISKSLGVTWERIGDVFIATGAVIVTSLDATIAQLEITVAQTKALAASMLAVSELSRGNTASGALFLQSAAGNVGDARAGGARLERALRGQTATDFIGRATAARLNGPDIGGSIGLGTTSGATERGSVEAAKVIATVQGGKQDEIVTLLRAINAEQKTARMNPNTASFGLARL
jgi:hypothetical protein